MRKAIYTLLLLASVGMVAAQDCDTLYGGILELQMQTRKGGLLYGNGYCIDAAVVNGGLEMVGGTLSVIDGDTVGQVLRWTGTTWEPRLIIFPDAVTGDTSYNGITYVPGSPNAHKLGGTLTENTTISGANTRSLTLNNLLSLSIEAERTSGTGYTTIAAGSTNIAGFDVFHVNPSNTNQQGYLRANYTTGNVLRLQNAANVQTEVLQYWDGASHVTDISSTDGVDNKTLRVTKTGVFALGLEKTDAFSEPGFMMWDTLTQEVRYQSPDIILGLANPVEPANQVVYGTGTGIDSDTSLTYNSNRVLNMKRRANDANPAIKIDVDDISTTGFWAFQIAPRNQTNYPWANRFSLLSGNYPLQTPGHEGNHVWRMGYNLDRSEPALSALEIAFESHFWQDMLDGRRTRNLEWHIEQRDTLGVVHRPISIRAAHDGSIGDVGLQSDGFYLTKYASGDSYMQYNRYNKIWYWNDTVTQVYNTPQVGYPFWRFRAADGSRLWKIAEPDASNRLVLNPEGNDLYTYAQNFIFHTTAGLRTSDGNNISIGNATYPTGLDVYSPNTYIFTMRAATANSGADIWKQKVGYFGGTGYFGIETPSGNDPFSIRGNAQNALLNLNNTSVGVNVFNPSAATLHVNGTVKLQGLPTRSTETKVVYADGNDLLAIGELSDFTGSGTTNYVPKWQTSTKLTDSQIIDNGTSVGVGNGGTFLTSGKLEVNKTYTNTTDANIVATGNLPLLTWRNSTNRFALGSNYHAASTLSLLGGGNTNPTNSLMKWEVAGDVYMDGGKFEATNGKVLAGGHGSSFGSTSPPSGTDFYVSISGGQRFRVQAASGLSYIDWWNAASGGNRNFTWATSYFSSGQLSLLQSSTAGGTPGTNLVTWTQSGNMGVQTSSAAQTLHVEGTARITGSDGEGTAIMLRDADGDISNATLDGLQIVGGTLSQSYDNNEYGNGTHTWNPSYIHVYANADVGNVTLNLSSPFSEGRDYFVAAVNNGTNTVTLSGTLYVDGVGSASSYTLGAWEQVTVRYRDAWGSYFIDK